MSRALAALIDKNVVSMVNIYCSSTISWLKETVMWMFPRHRNRGANSYMDIILIDIRDTFTNSSSGAEDNADGSIRLRWVQRSSPGRVLFFFFNFHFISVCQDIPRTPRGFHA